MQKVIPGSSREALSFIGQHWKNLLLISLIPLVCQIIVSYWQIKQLAVFYRGLGELAPGANPEALFMANYFKTMGSSGLGSILIGFLLAMMFSQIVRYRKGAPASLLPTDKASWKAAGMTAVYAIGIVLLTGVAYIAVVIGTVILALVIGGLLSLLGGAGAALGGLLVAAMTIGFVGFLIWFFFRFAVGLPGVALGHSPDFFKDLWALAKGEGFAVPLRMLLAVVIAYIPLGIVMIVGLGPSFAALIDNPALRNNPDNPLAIMPLMADVLERMAPLSALTSTLLLPFNWFFMLLLAVSFDRFLARVQANKTAGKTG